MSHDKSEDIKGGHYDAIVIGGGQAGLAMSYCLKQRGVHHLVLERNRLAYEWRERRWDTFCLVTPNWQCQLPGFPYPGADPDGFMKQGEIVEYLEKYAALFEPPLVEGATVTSLRRVRGVFHVTANVGSFTADAVIVATGGYHTPKLPPLAERLPDHVVKLHSSAYKNPEALAAGSVMVVGTGQSGCQIAEDLHLAGRKVYVCTGSAPRTARRYRGKDVVRWLAQMGYYDMPIHEHPLKERVRAKANHYVTGRDGGRDIDLRKFAAEGMELYGRLLGVKGDTLQFAPDLAANLDGADAVSESIKDSVDRFIESKSITAPTEPRYVPVWKPAEERVSLDVSGTNITTVIFSTGYRSDYRWVEVPVFDGTGYPMHDRGVTGVDGLYFVGLPWLYTWGSGRFSGVAADAEHLAERIVQRRGEGRSVPRIATSANELALGS
ncbi:MAG TPA: MSMEG_0569 family flavin-dependent oxidoreductase [Polyangiaceae bacterium]|jgi:putative flavoprotein involved in K+ transport|nr:MSMEG_0569 family flavin-dependent oxidoreductase [Polyangiaceae bacterium]